MNDHFGTDHAPRWAIAMLDPSRGVRIDFFVWQKRFKQDKALARVRGVLERIKPLLEECEQWQKKLLAGRIIAGEVREVDPR